jgi:hypothetical protein
MVWHVAEWGPTAEAYFPGTRAEEAHALLVCETHVAAGRVRDTETRMAYHGWRMVHSRVGEGDLEDLEVASKPRRRKARGGVAVAVRSRLASAPWPIAREFPADYSCQTLRCRGTTVALARCISGQASGSREKTWSGYNAVGK